MTWMCISQLQLLIRRWPLCNMYMYEHFSRLHEMKKRKNKTADETRTIDSRSIGRENNFTTSGSFSTNSAMKVNGEAWSPSSWDWRRESSGAEGAVLFAASADRNKEEMRAALEGAGCMQEGRMLLEIGSGTGQHVAHFAALHALARFVPSEMSETGRISIANRCKHLQNVAPPLDIDLLQLPDTLPQAQTVFASNVFHVAPAAIIPAMAELAQRVQASKCLFYGAFKRDGKFTTGVWQSSKKIVSNVSVPQLCFLSESFPLLFFFDPFFSFVQVETLLTPVSSRIERTIQYDASGFKSAFRVARCGERAGTGICQARL